VQEMSGLQERDTLIDLTLSEPGQTREPSSATLGGAAVAVLVAGGSDRIQHVDQDAIELVRAGRELASHDWWPQHSAQGTLIDFDFEAIGPSRLYRASDMLLKRYEALQDHLFAQAQQIVVTPRGLLR
jgi:hypothetical protein